MTAPQVVDARTGPCNVRLDHGTAHMARTIKAIHNHPTIGDAVAAAVELRYHQLGTRSIQVDDNTDDRLTAMSVKTGRTPGELVAIFVKSAPLVDPAPAADGPGERPDGVGEVAQATPTPSPAVTDALALVGLPDHKQPANLTAASDKFEARNAAGHVPAHVHLPGGPCVYGAACDQ